MKVSLLLLQLVSLSLQCSASSMMRSLAEDDRDEDRMEDENDDTYTFQQKVQDQWESFSNRMNEDAQGMWTTTPEEWGDEYWEVLISALAIIFSIALCFCLICCIPCCSDVGDDSPLFVATKEEVDEWKKKKAALRRANQKNLEEPILDGQTNLEEPILDDQTNPEEAILDSSTSPNYFQDALENVQNYVQEQMQRFNEPAASSDNPEDESKKRRRRRTLWQELKIVWEDFMTYGLSVNENDIDGSEFYEAPLESRRSSSRREKKRRQKRYEEATVPVTKLV